ncbi:uncharacterized protein METZ01_LOCUS307482, partial [marine metagenome]
MDYFDDLETRDPEVREQALLAELSNQIDNAIRNAPGWAKILSDVQPADLNSREALAELPITRKSELNTRQKNDPPFGGLTTAASNELDWVFCSPGPIYEPGARGGDFWRMGR